MSSSHDQKPAHEEPRTPPWLTALGISLFVIAGLGWLFTRPPQPTIEQMRAASELAPSPSPSQPSPAVPAASAPAAAPAPAAASSLSNPNLGARMRELRKVAPTQP